PPPAGYAVFPVAAGHHREQVAGTAPPPPGHADTRRPARGLPPPRRLAGVHLGRPGRPALGSRDPAQRGSHPRGGEGPPAGGDQRHGRTGPRSTGPAALRATVAGGDRPGAGHYQKGRRHALPARPETTQGNPERPARRPEGALTMSDSGSSSDLLNNLAHEFAERCRRGEHPALTEYTDKYPELAAEIRDLFPALAVMEELGSAGGPPTGPYPIPSQWDARVPERMGEYRILREVARGGMGIVYEAVQESLGRHVALKVLPPQRLTQPTRLERFRREAKAVARLHHTNIVPVFGVGEHEGVHYYAMQFIYGQGLDNVLKEVKKLRSGGAAGPVVEAPPEVVLSASIARSLVHGFPEPAAEPARGASCKLAGNPGKIETCPTRVESPPSVSWQAEGSPSGVEWAGRTS